jgi:hypothetical protein
MADVMRLMLSLSRKRQADKPAGLVLVAAAEGSLSPVDFVHCRRDRRDRRDRPAARAMMIGSSRTG